MKPLAPKQPRRKKTSETSAQEERDKPAAERYSVRDLSRRTAEVLAASQQRGQVIIRGRNGRSFILEPVLTMKERTDLAKAHAERMDRYWKKMKALGHKPMSAATWDALAGAIAGE